MSETPECPSCGSEDTYESVDWFWSYECDDCGMRFVPSRSEWQ